MTKVQEVIDYLHNIAPNNLQESYDNAGLIVGSGEDEVAGVIVSLDCTPEVIQEAMDKGCNLIISHHPIVFRGLKRFNGSDYVEKAVIKAIKNDINLFAIHTNLDNVRINGVNTKIAEILQLENLDILAPKDEEGDTGLGIVGQLMSEMDITKFFSYLKDKMQLKTFKHTMEVKQTVKKVAVCGGSGSFLLSSAIDSGADVFITSDFKYHEFFDHNGKIVIIDIGHYESERFTIDLLYELISNKFSTFAAHCTKINTNPVKYF
jgi:dinuclear metal center YbgI/SA1388 family protein